MHFMAKPYFRLIAVITATDREYRDCSYYSHRERLQRLQLLQPHNHPRSVAFAYWFVNQRAANMHFASSVLFCDEAVFSREGMFNSHNTLMWTLTNPHSARPRAAQQSFTVNVCASVVGDNLLYSYILPLRLDSEKYLVF
ncbi:uncharacterized protein TNCT_8111 [Trichonephila clavata]|uniref:Transposase n=1 Tax=Trichonephila clavata TaxID=2740835 RepID=A0A8X6I0S7_TRICU|nr:uncharacterized protein TNCT_8111 [Trichonephila clavata]